MKQRIYLATIGILSIVFSQSIVGSFDQESFCFENTYRCIIDIGSIATKMGCSDSLGYFRFEMEQPVGYRADLKKQQKNGLKCFSNEIKDQGVSAISFLIDGAKAAIKNRQDAEEVKQTECRMIKRGGLDGDMLPKVAFHAIATASLRSDPVCGNEIASKIMTETGVPLTIIDQYQEGKLAFQGIIAQLKRSPHAMISWDLGGGSTQIVTADHEGNLVHYLVEEGMFFFRDVLIKTFGKNEEEYHNELSLHEIRDAVALARQQITARIQQSATLQKIKESITQSQTLVVGTDGVEFIIRALTQNSQQGVFGRSEIESALEQCADMSDQDLGKRFNAFICPAFLAGAALLVGYMQALGIQTITLFSEGALRAGALAEDSFF